MVTPRRCCALFCVLAAVAVSACGSSKSSSTASGPSSSSSSSSTTGVTGAAIKLGMICSCSGPQSAALGATGQVIQAWAKSVNASGGLNGHPVNVIVKDDGQNPATALQAAKELVEQDKVIAIVGETSLVDTTWGSYAASQGVPVVGGIPVEPPFLTNPDFFPSGTQLVPQLFGMAALAKQAGKHDLGVLYCAESPVCAQLGPITGGAAKLNGLKSYAAKIAATAPDYTAPCLAAKSAGVDALFVGDNATVVQRVVAGCLQQGYTPLQVGNIGTVATSSLTQPGFAGARLAGANANPFDASTPVIQDFRTALGKYAPGVLSGAFSYDTIWAWSGGKLFEAAAKAAHITPSSTPADVKKGLYALKNETLGGLAPSLNFTPGKPAFVSCYFSVTIKGGKVVSLNNNEPTCLAPTVTKAIATELKKG